jgi:hypothetical protein
MVTLSNLQTWVAGLAFLVATVIALWGGIKYGPKGEWGSFFKVVGIAVVIMIITGGSFLNTVRDTGGQLTTEVTSNVKG